MDPKTKKAILGARNPWKTLADDDDYDPRKPEYIQEATSQEKGLQNAALLHQQIEQLEKALARGRKSRAPDIASHYQKVASEMRISAQQLLSGDASMIEDPFPQPRRRHQQTFGDESKLPQDSPIKLMPFPAKRQHQAKASLSPCHSDHHSARCGGLWKCWLHAWSGMRKNGSWPPMLFSASTCSHSSCESSENSFGDSPPGAHVH